MPLNFMNASFTGCERAPFPQVALPPPPPAPPRGEPNPHFPSPLGGGGRGGGRSCARHPTLTPALSLEGRGRNERRPAHSVASLCLCAWHSMVTATGRLVMWQGDARM